MANHIISNGNKHLVSSAKQAFGRITLYAIVAACRYAFEIKQWLDPIAWSLHKTENTVPCKPLTCCINQNSYIHLMI